MKESKPNPVDGPALLLRIVLAVLAAPSHSNRTILAS